MPRVFATDEERKTFERERARKRRAAETPEQHRERLAQGRVWYDANRERKRASNQAWKEANPERVLEMARAGYWRHREKNIARVVAYIQRTEGFAAHARRRRAKERGAPGRVTKRELAIIFAAQNGICLFCDADLDIVGYHVDHLTPLARGGTNWPENLVFACPTCNSRKGAKTMMEMFS